MISNGPVIEELGLENANAIAQIMVDTIEANDGFSNSRSTVSLNQNPIYHEEIDGTNLEMEVLTAERSREYGGEGTKTQEGLENAFKIIQALINPPNSYYEISETVTEELVGIIVDGLVDQYKSRKYLKEDDVRISFKPDHLKGSKYQYDYFLRDNQLMFVTLGKDAIWYNKEFMNVILKETQE